MAPRTTGTRSRHLNHPIVTEIRCAAGGGRCGRLRGLVLGFPRPPTNDVVLIITTEGTPAHTKHGVLLELLVPRSFEGVADTVMCPNLRHNESIEGEYDSTDTWTTPWGRRLSGNQTLARGLGSSNGMPFRLLRAPYERFMATGRTQPPVEWKVGIVAP